MNQKGSPRSPQGEAGFALILVLAGVLLAVAILFTPVPYYQKEDAICESWPPQKCPQKGWHLGVPLWKRILPLTQEKAVLQPPVQPSPSPTDASREPNGSAETANWKTHTIQKIGLSMQYPPNWNVLEIKYPYPDEEIRFEGPEGRISVKLGRGFGGGCPIPIAIKISGQELAGCKSGDINEQHLSFGKETNIPVDLGNGTQGKLSLQVDMYAAPPGQINLNTILKILSTFKFTQ